jgi:NAD(P)-dependent dehydrogenase (short-subunit alcohol dehydrogenase family)
MHIDLSGLTALVTGSTAGIGFATAKRLAGAGARTIVNGRTPARVETAVGHLREAVPGAEIAGVASDVASGSGCAELARATGPVDILVNNMGIFEPKPFLEIPDADWFDVFEANVMSGVRLARAFLPAMLERNWGRVVFVSSESGIQIPVEMIHYGMSKTAQIAIARGLAEMATGTGVTVNSVLPGPTLSEGVGDFMGKLAEQEGTPREVFLQRFVPEFRGTSVIQRFAEPDEIASMVVYLCSRQASATTGAPVRVDGGVIRAAF